MNKTEIVLNKKMTRHEKAEQEMTEINHELGMDKTIQAKNKTR